MIVVINMDLYSRVGMFSEHLLPKIYSQELLNLIFKSPMESACWYHGKRNSFVKIGNFPGRKYEISDL